MTSVSLLVWKIEPLLDQLVAQLAGVDEVAVVGDGDLPVRAVDQERLGVARAGSRRRSSSGCGRSPGARAASRASALSKASATWPIARDARIRAPSARDDAGALLPAVLERVEAEVREVGGLGMTEDPEDAALVLELVEHGCCAASALPATGTAFYAARLSPCRAKCRRCAVTISLPPRPAAQSSAGRPATAIRIARAAGRADQPLPARRLGRQLQERVALAPGCTRRPRPATRTRRTASRHRSASAVGRQSPPAMSTSSADAAGVERALRQRHRQAAVGAVVRRLQQPARRGASTSSSMQRPLARQVERAAARPRPGRARP